MRSHSLSIGSAAEMHRLGIDIGGSSIKVCLIDSKSSHVARSSNYVDPTRAELSIRVREAVEELAVDIHSDTLVGLCLPGKHAQDGKAIERSVNLPCLDGWAFDDLLQESLGWMPRQFRVLSDVQAAGVDYIHQHKVSDRTAIIAVGTGVGLSVFDDNIPVGIGTRGIGHIGMMDIGRLDHVDRIAHDGARNTLESYIGSWAIEQRFPGVKSVDLPGKINQLGLDEPIIQAIVRAIRIVHAIYVPDQVVLMGGVGIALELRHNQLHTAISEGLTTLANSDWSLRFGDSPYHAARGAALLVM